MDKTSMDADPELRACVQLAAVRRLYRETKGREPQSLNTLAKWVRRRSRTKTIEPTDADYETVKRDHPDLVAVAAGRVRIRIPVTECTVRLPASYYVVEENTGEK